VAGVGADVAVTGGVNILGVGSDVAVTGGVNILGVKLGESRVKVNELPGDSHLVPECIRDGEELTAVKGFFTWLRFELGMNSSAVAFNKTEVTSDPTRSGSR